MRERGHERVQADLPALEAGELGRVRRRRVERHLRRCPRCTAELERQRQVADELALLSADVDASVADAAPPEDLLETLLAQAREPGVRERVAVPARGAISGARPGLSVALVLTVAALVALAGWAGWRLGRAIAERESG